ncbi:hypothetical protein T265_04471 [Opisthorchis viverrini]|uniref:Uncharacterized protein n=1 Tax=Opisthorchis viverrini TaxID=6198 RepID=A0A074ZNU9_OPIVI|nr:hypothetical protein T265_04471 [Opisthorchis viverrini]KER28781.1 hypothetical protein T265_04471 [Opisthorchis viverrini]
MCCTQTASCFSWHDIRDIAGQWSLKQCNNHPSIAPFRCPSAMPPEGYTRVGILPGSPSLDRGSRGAKVGFEPRTFRSCHYPTTGLIPGSQVNRSTVAPFRCLTAMPHEGGTRAGILPDCPSLDRGSQEAKVGFEPRTFRSVNSRSNHLVHLAPSQVSETVAVHPVNAFILCYKVIRYSPLSFPVSTELSKKDLHQVEGPRSQSTGYISSRRPCDTPKKMTVDLFAELSNWLANVSSPVEETSSVRS